MVKIVNIKAEDQAEHIKITEKVLFGEISKHTIPLFENTPTIRAILIGTGVFVKDFNEYYILTASHVVDDLVDESFKVATVSGFVTIEGTFYCSRESVEDSAFVLLAPGLGELLSYSYTPIGIHQVSIDLPHYPNSPHYVFGFPFSRFKRTRTVAQAKPLGIHMFLSRDYVYKRVKRDPSTHFILDLWRAEMSDGRKAKIKSPRGLSGSGLWWIEIDKIGERITTRYLLIGIMNQYRNHPNHVLIGTRASLIFEQMEAAYFTRAQSVGIPHPPSRAQTR